MTVFRFVLAGFLGLWMWQSVKAEVWFILAGFLRLWKRESLKTEFSFISLVFWGFEWDISGIWTFLWEDFEETIGIWTFIQLSFKGLNYNFEILSQITFEQWILEAFYVDSNSPKSSTNLLILWPLEKPFKVRSWTRIKESQSAYIYR